MARPRGGPELGRRNLAGMGQDLGGGPASGTSAPANDSWIAACCLARQFALATHNVKDFEDFAAHDGLQLITSSR
jgi:toxin FitB